MKTFKVLADTNTREANRLLISALNQENLALRRREYIFRKLIQNRVLEKDCLNFLGKIKREKESFFQILKEFQKNFPKVLPDPTLLDLHLNKGFSFPEIREKKKNLRKKGDLLRR